MLRKEDFAVIEALNRRGVYHKDIAEELEVHPRTVKRALERGGAPKAERRVGPSKLDPYRAKVNELLEEGVWNSQVILREIQALGYEGGSTMLRLYIQPKRTLRPGRATVRLETEPGHPLQSDWGEVFNDPVLATAVLDRLLHYGHAPEHFSGRSCCFSFRLNTARITCELLFITIYRSNTTLLARLRLIALLMFGVRQKTVILFKVN